MEYARGNVVSVNCSNVSKYTNIVKQLEFIHNKCNDKFSCYNWYDKKSEYKLLYITDNVKYSTLTDLLEKLNQTPYLITAVIDAILVKNIIEIYNACYINSDKGINTIIRSITLNFKKTRIWVGIDLNDSWYDKAELYARHAFGYPMLSRNTGGSARALNNTVLSMTWDHDIYHDYDETLEIAQSVINQYLKARTKCISGLHIGPKVINTLKSYLTRSQEVGGHLFSDGYITGPDGAQYINLFYNTSTIEIGTSNGRNFRVNLAPSQISFHTHPDICYTADGCYVAWPSGPDMRTIIVQYPILLKHYVVTKEGIYAVQLSLDMQNFIDNNMSSKDHIASVALEKFAAIEQYRSEVIKPELRQLSVQDFMIFANTFTISDIIGSEIPVDFTVYSVNFYDWDNLKNPNGLDDCLISLSCNIEFMTADIDMDSTDTLVGIDSRATHEYNPNQNKKPRISC